MKLTSSVRFNLIMVAITFVVAIMLGFVMEPSGSARVQPHSYYFFKGICYSGIAYGSMCLLVMLTAITQLKILLILRRLGPLLFIYVGWWFWAMIISYPGTYDRKNFLGDLIIILLWTTIGLLTKNLTKEDIPETSTEQPPQDTTH